MLRPYFTLAAAMAGLLALLVFAWWPISHNEALTWGIDAYQYHSPIFGRHTQSQDIIAHQPIEVLGALLVPLHRDKPVPDVQMTLQNGATNETLQTYTIAGHTLVDDAFTYVRLDPPLFHRQPIRVIFASPDATTDSAVGIRFHPDDVYPAGGRLFDNEVVKGDLALSWQRRLPIWQVIGKSAEQTPQKTTALLQAGFISLLAASIASQLGWARQHASRQRWIELGLLGTLALLTIASRLPALGLLGGVSGGDPYNYLSITENISQLENPWADKRLPGYPLLLLPAYLTALDDHLWMRLVNVVSAGGIVLLVGLLARTIGLPWSIQFFSALLLAFQKDFYWISLRPEAYTVYAFLLTASLLLFFSLTTWRRRLLFGLALGYAAMTRQEGFVLAAVLGLAAGLHLVAALRPRITKLTQSPRQLLASYTLAFLPALALVTPFFVHNAVAYGNPLYTPYFKGERLNIVDSWPAWQDALGATWGILGSLWKTSWDQLERVPLHTPLLAVSALVSLLWWVYHRQRAPRQTAAESMATILISLALLGLAIFSYIHKTNMFTSFFPMIAAALLVSPLALIGTARLAGLLLVIVAASQIGIATWFHPFPKHYQQDLPLIALALSVLLIASANGMANPRRRLAIGATYVTIAFALALTTVPLYQSSQFNANIDQYNQSTALDSVVYRALQMARTLPEPYGVDQAYLSARLYLGKRAYYYNNDAPSEAEQLNWLNRNNVKTVVTTNADNIFGSLPDTWQRVGHFKAEGEDEQILESFVYVRR